MYPITTLTDQCRKCYSCVRSCPVKAIKVEKSYTEIICERCIREADAEWAGSRTLVTAAAH